MKKVHTERGKQDGDAEEGEEKENLRELIRIYFCVSSLCGL